MYFEEVQDSAADAIHTYDETTGTHTWIDVLNAAGTVLLSITAGATLPTARPKSPSGPPLALSRVISAPGSANADPHVASQLWANAGVLTVSAG